MVVDWQNVDWYSVLDQHGTVPRAKHQKRTKPKNDKDNRDVFDLYCAFDIETSTVWLNEDHSLYDVHSFLYSWAFQIEDMTALGRDWDSFFAF